MASISSTGSLGHQDDDEEDVPRSKIDLNRQMRYDKAMALKSKTLAVDTHSPITAFLLAAQQQEQSLFLSRVPPEVRKMIYKFRGIEPGKIHLYEQRGRIVGYTCEDEDISRPCLGTSSCHRVDGQINEVTGGYHNFRFAYQKKVILPCPSFCSCQPLNLLALVLTCQAVHMEILAFLYHSQTFVISKAVFSTILNADVAIQQYTLSSPLSRIKQLQLDLGNAKEGTTQTIQSKHATLRAVLQTAVNLKELSVVFNTRFGRMNQSPLDNVTVRLLSRFRGLDNFQLVVQNARDCYQNSDVERVTADERRFIRAVPYIGDIYTKFVKLRNMTDTTGLDALEKLMAKSESRFEKGLKQKVNVMLAGEADG